MTDPTHPGGRYAALAAEAHRGTLARGRWNVLAYQPLYDQYPVAGLAVPVIAEKVFVLGWSGVPGVFQARAVDTDRTRILVLDAGSYATVDDMIDLVVDLQRAGQTVWVVTLSPEAENGLPFPAPPPALAEVDPVTSLYSAVDAAGRPRPFPPVLGGVELEMMRWMYQRSNYQLQRKATRYHKQAAVMSTASLVLVAIFMVLVGLRIIT